MNPMVKEIVLRTIALSRPDQSGKVVFYHDVHNKRRYAKTSSSLHLLDSHVKIARENGFKFTPILPLKNKEVMMCFDDGYHGVYDCRQYFIDMDVHPVIFLAVDLIGKDGYLSWEEIKELHHCGFIFQSHTCSHRTLTEVPRSELKRELNDSKRIIEDKLGCTIKWLCFPRGRFTKSICEEAYQCGYEKLFSSIPGNSEGAGSEGLVCRNIVQSLTPKAFLATLNGGANLFYGRYYKMHCLAK